VGRCGKERELKKKALEHSISRSTLIISTQ